MAGKLWAQEIPFAFSLRWALMQRRKLGGLNPTLLEGSPRNAAGEYAACMGLADDVDAQAAMRADGLAWKERGFRTLRTLAVHRVASWTRPLLGVRESSSRRAGVTTYDSGLARGVVVLLQQTRGTLSAQAALARGNMSLSYLELAVGLSRCSLMRDMRGLGHVLCSSRQAFCFDMPGPILSVAGGYPRSRPIQARPA